MTGVDEYRVSYQPTWCPGCGNYGIWNSLKTALANLDIQPHQTLIVSGIGCGSKLPDFTHANGIMTLHGRPLPVATGARLANHSLKVVITHGDGDGYSIGGNHMIHAMRRNIDVVDICQNNKVLGLTKGQYSPTSDPGCVSRTTPQGSIEQSVNPIAIALAAGATFVSRGFSGDVKHLTWLIEQALQHRGYSIVDVLQPCVAFNKLNTYQWYQARVYKLQDAPEYDLQDKGAAFERSQEWGGRIPIGIFYRNDEQPTYEEQLPVLEAGPLVKRPLRSPLPESLKNEFM